MTESGAGVKSTCGRKGTAAAKSGVTESSTTETAQNAENAAQKVSIYPYDAVAHLAVYEIPKGVRLHEVLVLASDFSENAAQDTVGLAAVVKNDSVARMSTVEEAARGTAGVFMEEDVENGKVGLNRADKEVPARLSGAGEREAEQVLAYREAYGKFKSMEEIKKIPDIKEKVSGRSRDNITVLE